MRLLFIVLSVLIDCLAFVPQKSKELSINLKYVTTEKSKDSYSITETWKLEKNTLTFSYVNTNKRKTIAPKTVAAKLTASDLDSLVKIIRKNELLVNVPAEKRNEYAVPYTAIGVTLSITAGQEKGSISLYALKNAMGANVYYRHVEKLRSAMRKFIKE